MKKIAPRVDLNIPRQIQTQTIDSPMKVHIQQIHEKGNFANEYVSLKVAEDCDIGRYMLSDSTYTAGGSLSNKVRHIYWYPDKQVKAGDFVWLYTRPKRAEDKSEWSNKAETTTHAFYWGLHQAVWNDDGDYAVLFELTTWEIKKVGG